MSREDPSCMMHLNIQLCKLELPPPLLPSARSLSTHPGSIQQACSGTLEEAPGVTQPLTDILFFAPSFLIASSRMPFCTSLGRCRTCSPPTASFAAACKPWSPPTLLAMRRPVPRPQTLLKRASLHRSPGSKLQQPSCALHPAAAARPVI